MLMPSIFGESLFDEMFRFPYGMRYMSKPSASTEKSAGIPAFMKTDVKETENGYEVAIDLPGYSKDDVKAELKDGYLTITAFKNSGHEEKDDKTKYIRKERYTGQCSRTFYVGEGVMQDDIKASFRDGILYLGIPKKDKKAVEEPKYIPIEG